MRSSPHLSLRCLVLLLVELVGAGCASHLPPLNTSGQAFTPASDEALLWERATREHRKLSGSYGLLRDPVLEAYLLDVAHRLCDPLPTFHDPSTSRGHLGQMAWGSIISHGPENVVTRITST